MPQIANTEYDTQLFKFQVHITATPPPSLHNIVPIIHYDRLSNILNSIDWCAIFSNCITTDDYVNVFTSQLYSAIDRLTTYKQHCKRERLPKHMVQMLRRKKSMDNC